MVQIKYMEKPCTCIGCPFFKVVNSGVTVYDNEGKIMQGVYTDYYQCAFVSDYADANIDDESDEYEDFLCNTSVHSPQEDDFCEHIEPWCPIRECEETD